MTRSLILACVLLMGAGGCLPDLVPGQHTGAIRQNQVPPDYHIEIAVKNSGRGPSARTLVYFNAIDATSPTRPVILQETRELPPLPRGASRTLGCDFELSRLHAGSASVVEVLVDPKGMVKELDENNNRVQWNLPW